VSWFLGWLFGPRNDDEPEKSIRDTSQEALEMARSARLAMAHESHTRRREVAEVRLDQMKLRRDLNILEQTILADRLRAKEGDGE
jgi:hypothetical protein